MIQAGVAWATCWRSLIQRLTMSQAKQIMQAAPATHMTWARRRANGASTIGSRSRLIRTVPNRFPAIG